MNATYGEGGWVCLLGIPIYGDLSRGDLCILGILLRSHEGGRRL